MFSNFFLINVPNRLSNYFFNKTQDGKLLMFTNDMIVIFAFILIKSVEVSQEIEVRGFPFLTLGGIINNYG